MPASNVTTKPLFLRLLAGACALHLGCGGSGPRDSEPGAQQTAPDGSAAASGASSNGKQAAGTAGTTSASPAKPSANNSGQSAAAGSGIAGSSDPQSAAGNSATAGSAGSRPPRVIPPGSVSKPGEYSGYGDKLYNGFELSSRYVEMRDGTKLAVDLYRPKEQNGQVTEAPLPVVWMHTPYNRRFFASAAGAGLAGEVYPGAAALLVDYGYLAAVVDFRGVYASYGKNEGYNRGEWMDAARMDAYDISHAQLCRHSHSTHHARANGQHLPRRRSPLEDHATDHRRGVSERGKQEDGMAVREQFGRATQSAARSDSNSEPERSIQPRRADRACAEQLKTFSSSC